MRVLVVAHPDDEVLWFDPSIYDKIVICFLEVQYKGYMYQRRVDAVAEHPLREKIELLRMTEPTVSNVAPTREELIKRLSDMAKDEGWTEVDTHSATGEYGHEHHRMVFRACMEAMAGLGIPVNGLNPDLYLEIREVYKKHRCWTWDT